MDTQLLAEAQALRTMYHRWCCFEDGAPGYSELCIESTPRLGNDSPSALGMVAEAARRVLTIALGSADQATLVWDGAIDNGEDLAYNIEYVRSQLCVECKEHGPQLVCDEQTFDGFAGGYITHFHLECGHTVEDASDDIAAAR